MPSPISWAHAWPYLAAALAFGYACGAVPFGLLLTRFAGLGDIRAIGSGSIGATNVLRSGHKGAALLTLLGDGTKGWLAVFLASRYGPSFGLGVFGVELVALAVFFGHLFPVFLRFKGGKGVATAAGVLLAIDLRLGLATLATWLLIAITLRYSSLAALVAENDCKARYRSKVCGLELGSEQVLVCGPLVLLARSQGQILGMRCDQP